MKHTFHFFYFFNYLPAGHRRPASEIGKTCEQQLSADRALMKRMLLDSVGVQNDQQFAIITAAFWAGGVSRSKYNVSDHTVSDCLRRVS